MSKSGWFRFYHDLFSERKFRRLTRDEKLIVIAAWCLASRSPERGWLMVGKGLPATAADLADEAQVSEVEVMSAIGTPDKPGSLVPCWLAWDGQTLVVHDWGDWQYDHPSDAPEAARERKRKQRERERNTKSHDDVTSESRQGHEIDTDSDSDSDSESDKESKNPPTIPPEASPSKKERTQRTKTDYTEAFEIFWSVYRRKDDKKGAFDKWSAILRKKTATAEELLEAARNYMAYREDQNPQYDFHGKTFLNERWREYDRWRSPPPKHGGFTSKPSSGQVKRPGNDVWTQRRGAMAQ